MAKKKKKDIHYTDEGVMVPFGEGAKQYKAEGGVAKVLPKEDPAKRAEMKRRYYKKSNPQYVAKGERRFFIDDPDRGTGEYTVSYSNNMGNTHYACPFGGKNPSASSELGCLGLAESSDQLATGSIPFRVLFGNGTFGDYNELTFAILGDLA